MPSPTDSPEVILSDSLLIDRLTRPSAALVESITQVSSPLVVIGAGGKMGPTLCAMARRAALIAGHPLRVVAVSRFSQPQAKKELERAGVETLPTDLLDRQAVQRLPDTDHVLSLIGLKFGTTGNPSLTWAVNTLTTAHLAERYAHSRIVALSTGNVYPPMPAPSLGASEEHPLTPVGEYANAAIARERLFEYYSHLQKTPVALLRLSYAVELRYGVLVDIARAVWESRPLQLSNGWINWIWQADAHDLILRSFTLTSSPASAWNLTHPQALRVRDVALEFARHFHKEPLLVGTEAPDALLSNPARLCSRLGPPPTRPDQVIGWIADWLRQGGASLNKPTHFETRDGVF